MKKAFKYRIYPNKTQAFLLHKTFGCTRFYWNQLVATFRSYDKDTNPHPHFPTQKELKQSYPWLGEVSAAALQQKYRDFQQFQRQLFNKGRKKQLGLPRFRKKFTRQSYRLPAQKFKLLEGKIQLEKIGKVKCVIARSVPKDAPFVSVTISKNCAGHYFVSIVVETASVLKAKTHQRVGVDVGLKVWATFSDGRTVENPRFLKRDQHRLKQLQQYYAKKQKGSRRQQKCKLKIARLHNSIANRRSWFLHQATTDLVNDYDLIAIEDLNVSGMLKNHKLSGAISDVSWSEFRRLLTYKCSWYGKELVVVSRFAPTSKTCSDCGWKDRALTLKDRLFECQNCHLTIDRDYNAAKNIHALGVDSAQGTLRGAVTNLNEASRVT